MFANIMTEVYVNPFVLYILGMTLVVVLAVIFFLSIRYYIKAKDLAPYLSKIEDKKKEITELEEKIDVVQKQFDEKLNEFRDAKLTLEQKEAAKNWLDEHQEQIHALHKDIEVAHGNLEILNNTKTNVEEQLRDRRQELVGIDEKIVKRDEEFKKIHQEIQECLIEKEQILALLPKLTDQVNVLKSECEEKQSLLNQLNEKINILNEEINRKHRELEAIDGQYGLRKETLNDIQGKINEASHNLATMKNECASLEGKAMVAQEILAEMRARRTESEEKWKNLDAPVIVQESVRNRGIRINEIEWLNNFADKLQEHGFIFDKRSIFAFHTGLKCAKQTPLVVLAGISGTGKSLLPELYASALGMNFLSVPVQPRWDSPQDLFGFYNYMEGRYKATELSRLLWQFDFYNNGNVRDVFAKKEMLPLNLVLLDEMNLARVEYYFSDLLSKLETRNGIDEENANERKKSEIELECNAAVTIDSMRRLYVSPYTLFVGTMNEDESTQSLSDKVIDRSNVLRFGRPRILAEENGGVEIEPDKSGFVNEYVEASRIDVETWNDWCVLLDEQIEERDEGLNFLRQTVTPLVEVLDKVYRSYGYRVDKAMKLYVKNYPGDYRHAVADQIEMKILPKLNGLELQDVYFEEVKNAMITAIEATEDESLMKAFEDACPEGGTFFKWRGVMR
jgi:predicted  nucleic acid-binding Zn-ribbon protein